MADNDDAATNKEDNEEVYDVERLLEAAIKFDEEDNKKTYFYLVNWEPERNINTDECINDFWNKIGDSKPAVSSRKIGDSWKPDDQQPDDKKPDDKKKRTSLIQQNKPPKRPRVSSPGPSTAKKAKTSEPPKPGQSKKRITKKRPHLSDGSSFEEEEEVAEDSDSDVEVVEATKSTSPRRKSQRMSDAQESPAKGKLRQKRVGFKDTSDEEVSATKEDVSHDDESDNDESLNRKRQAALHTISNKQSKRGRGRPKKETAKERREREKYEAEQRQAEEDRRQAEEKRKQLLEKKKLDDQKRHAEEEKRKEEEEKRKEELERKKRENEEAIKNGTKVPTIRKETGHKVKGIDAPWNYIPGHHNKARLTVFEGNPAYRLGDIPIPRISQTNKEHDSEESPPVTASKQPSRPSGIRTPGASTGPPRPELPKPTRGERQYPASSGLIRRKNPSLTTPRAIEGAFTPRAKPPSVHRRKEHDDHGWGAATPSAIHSAGQSEWDAPPAAPLPDASSQPASAAPRADSPDGWGVLADDAPDSFGDDSFDNSSAPAKPSASERADSIDWDDDDDNNDNDDAGGSVGWGDDDAGMGDVDWGDSEPTTAAVPIMKPPTPPQPSPQRQQPPAKGQKSYKGPPPGQHKQSARQPPPDWNSNQRRHHANGGRVSESNMLDNDDDDDLLESAGSRSFHNQKQRTASNTLPLGAKSRWGGGQNKASEPARPAEPSSPIVDPIPARNEPQKDPRKRQQQQQQAAAAAAAAAQAHNDNNDRAQPPQQQTRVQQIQSSPPPPPQRPPSPPSVPVARPIEPVPEALFKEDDEEDNESDDKALPTSVNKESPPPPLSHDRPVYTKNIPSEALWKGLMYAHRKRVATIGLLDVTGEDDNGDDIPRLSMQQPLQALSELKLDCFVDVCSFQKHVNQVDQIVEVLSPDQSMRDFIKQMVELDKIGVYRLDEAIENNEKEGEDVEEGEVTKQKPIRLIAFAPAKIPDLRVFYNLPKENQIFALLVITTSGVIHHFERIEQWDGEDVYSEDEEEKARVEREVDENKKREYQEMMRQEEIKTREEATQARDNAFTDAQDSASMVTSNSSGSTVRGDAQQEPVRGNREVLSNHADAVKAPPVAMTAHPQEQRQPPPQPQPARQPATAPAHAPAPGDPRLTLRPAGQNEAVASTSATPASTSTSRDPRLAHNKKQRASERPRHLVLEEYKFALSFSSSRMTDNKKIDGKTYRISASQYHEDESNQLRALLNELHRCVEVRGSPQDEAAKKAPLRFIHLRQIPHVHSMPNLVQTRRNKDVKFFLFGTDSRVSKALWRMQEIYKSGGLVTFTSRALTRDTDRVVELLELFAVLREKVREKERKEKEKEKQKEIEKEKEKEKEQENNSKQKVKEKEKTKEKEQEKECWEVFVLDDVYKKAVDKLEKVLPMKWDKEPETHRLELLKGLFHNSSRLKSMRKLPPDSTEPAKDEDKPYIIYNNSRHRGTFDGNSIIRDFRSSLPPEADNNPDGWMFEEIKRIQSHVDIRVPYRRYIVIDVEGITYGSGLDSIEKHTCASFIEEMKQIIAST
ncbi:hypothetical protein E3P99_02942 [Wallemia hederae]|uniref:Chromo domain-containing protein n=1 Tax=Wallemia hederae TaxID=1540922 RepID=A0A4T0FJL4_9BASI|nr:hypothetical protein E3P99_02942 [Wallemia hederae]